MNEVHHDVIIIGAGGAGLRAAMAVVEANPDLSIGLVSKVYPMRSHTVAAEGGMAAVIKANDAREHHIYDTISGSDWLADQDAVEMFVDEAPRELIQLEHWGCPWSREDSGHVAVRPFGGMQIERTWYAADKTGFHVLHTLFQTSVQFSQITRYDEFFATSLLTADGRCQGCVALELRTGEVHVLRANAVLICTGGFGRIFPFTTNGSIKTGDGLALAYRAGVALKDMEFVQYHPTGLPGTGILITEASRGEGGILLNNRGSALSSRTTTWARRWTFTIRAIRRTAQWNSGRATGCPKRSCTSKPRGAPSTESTAITCTWMCAISAKSASIRTSHSYANSPSTTPASIRSTIQFRYGPSCTT